MTKLSLLKTLMIKEVFNEKTKKYDINDIDKLCILFQPFEKIIFEFSNEFNKDILQICNLFFNQIEEGKNDIQIINEVKFYLIAEKLNKKSKKYNEQVVSTK